jgi:hypothetical protein
VISGIRGDMIVLLRLARMFGQLRGSSMNQVYVSWRIIEVDRGEVDMRHGDVGLRYDGKN